MFLKVKDLKGKGGRCTITTADTAYIYLNSEKFHTTHFPVEIRDGRNPLFAIIDNIPQFVGYTAFIPYCTIVDKESEENLLETLKHSNLVINNEGDVEFADYQELCFEVDGNILSYDEFCKYELPKNQVFKTVYDNGYSYFGSEPFRGDAKKYADTAIKVAKAIKRPWFAWRMGFRLNKLLCVDVVHGKDEYYSEISNT